MNLTIRNLTAADLEAADHIYQAAFVRNDSRKAEIKSYLILEPQGWFLALLDDAPAGFVGTINYGPFAYIGMMCVHPAAQRKGIGRALLERLLGWLDRQGCPLSLLDATQAGAPLYLNLGFTDDGETYRCHLRGPIPLDNAAAQIHVLQPEDVQALAHFDTPIFGANRAAVLADYLDRFPARAFSTHDEAGRISGYIFAQTNRIGPWVARRPEEAQALLGRALALDYRHWPILVVPAANRAAMELLQRSGPVMDGPWRHMKRGAAPSPMRYEMIYGLASYTLG